MNSATVLVTDGEQRSSLAIVRSLGRAGLRVHVTSRSGKSLSGASRHCRRDHQVPPPLESPEDFCSALAECVESASADVVLPTTDASILALLPERNRLAETVLPMGDETSFRAISNKDRVVRAARDIGIRVPRQHVLDSPEDALPTNLEWPLVFKPSRSVDPDRSGGAQYQGTVKHVAHHEQLATEIANASPAAFPVLLQERVTGPGVGVFLLRWDAETRAVFGHRRLREKPPSGGVSVYRESVTVEDELVRRSERLVDAFGWEGLAMVEYKVDHRTGDSVLMEVNARPWGSLQLAVDAGVDFPRLLIDAALGEPLPHAPPDYRPGIRTRWLWGDVDHLIARMKGGVPGDAGSANRPHRLRAATDFLTWRSEDRLEVLKASDFRPFLRESAAWLKTAFGLDSGR